MSASTTIAIASRRGRRPLRIGMIGGGTVGGGVYEIIMNRLNKENRAVIITKLCVRDATKPRNFHVDDSITTITTNVDSILQDPDIDIIVEVMGGTGLAKRVVLEALEKKKSVVTANKALVAEHLPELKEASCANNTILAYEAAVCGGIPIIQTLCTCYAGDVIQEIMGICNGTTNYMLGKMQEGAEYHEVLKEAQELGYAEADPTADVEGHDVRAKICILAKLAFGTTVLPEQVPCCGISQITSVDFEYAKSMECTIKLVGTATIKKDGLSVYVAPHIVSRRHLLASARGSGNVVAVMSANLGTASYAGPGAGRYPTAHSVVADVMRIADGVQPQNPFPLETEMELEPDYSSCFYIRIPFVDSLGIVRNKIGELAKRHGVSIHSILQNPIRDQQQADFCLTTEECKMSQAQALCADIDKEGFATSYPLCMPLLMELH